MEPLKDDQAEAEAGHRSDGVFPKPAFGKALEPNRREECQLRWESTDLDESGGRYSG